jgi:hypothetical protein
MLHCLYHGNLSVEENEKAAVWLLENVFNDLSTPSSSLENPAPNCTGWYRYKNCCLVPDPSDQELKDIIAKPSCMYPSFNCTG